LEDFSQFPENFDHWSWWILALVLFIIELGVPGIVFFWLGLAAVATGFMTWLTPELGWKIEFALFAVLGITAAIIGRRYWKPGKISSANSTLNQRAAQFIGQTFTLETAIENGHGRIKIADGGWLVSGPNLPAGTQVKVISADGARLVVEAAS
jgi:membrane protein implicated in regulation of membrane protease activity